jgi:hypothetical protein
MAHPTLQIPILTLCAALSISGRLACAEEQPVSSDDVARITIDTETVKPRGAFIRAGFWAYTGDERIPVIAMVEGCKNGSGRISYNVLDPDKPEAPTKVAEWSAGGETMLDRMAAIMCQLAKGG